MSLNDAYNIVRNTFETKMKQKEVLEDELQSLEGAMVELRRLICPTKLKRFIESFLDLRKYGQVSLDDLIKKLVDTSTYTKEEVLEYINQGLQNGSIHEIREGVYAKA
jgi:hypothetical protein